MFIKWLRATKHQSSFSSDAIKYDEKMGFWGLSKINEIISHLFHSEAHSSTSTYRSALCNEARSKQIPNSLKGKENKKI